MHSLRGRLTLLLVLSLGLLLCVSGGLLDTVIRTQLVREFDRVLLARAQSLIALTEDEGSVVTVEVELEFETTLMPEFGEAADRPEYFAMWLPSGALLAKSPSLGAHDLQRPPTLTNVPLFRDFVLPDGRAGRLVEMAFVPRGVHATTCQDNQDDADTEAEPVVLHPTQCPLWALVLLVARDREDLDTLLATLRLALALGVAGLLAVLVILVRLTLRLGLRPLDEIRRQVARLDIRSLTTGIRIRTQTTELSPIVRQLNDLLRRLDAAFLRERQFSSDVAHELRTPLAELRTLTDVGLRWPEDTQAVTQYFADAQAICLHMERIVVSLLTLARCEEGTLQVSSQPINVRELVEASWALVAHPAEEKTLTFQYTIPPTYCVTSDRALLHTVLNNLLHNAVAYSPPQSIIHCVAAAEGQAMRLTIRNLTDDLTPADLPHVFERFWRKDPARTAGDHTGLGLAIVQALSALLHLGVDVALDAEHHFVIALSFPGADSL
jgi:two-component system, OmpR family, heavy metal sensor histidine kinase CusS